jgi:hypothetical protein
MTFQEFVEVVKQVSGFWALVNEAPEQSSRRGSGR